MGATQPGSGRISQGSPAILGVAGYSGSGKTTLITSLLPRLAQGGLRVATLKHSHHGFDVLPDDHIANRLRAAGAAEVLVAGNGSWATTRGPGDPGSHPLATVPAQCTDCDLVLVEGFKHHPFAKIEVWRPATGVALMAPADPYVIAVATDMADTVRAVAGAALPVMDLGDLGAISALVLRYCKALNDRQSR